MNPKQMLLFVFGKDRPGMLRRECTEAAKPLGKHCRRRNRPGLAKVHGRLSERASRG